MLTGDLREFGTADVLGLLGRSGVDGALVVDGAASATVHCRGGDVTFATTRLGTSLADVLVTAGFLDAADWAEAARGEDPPAALARALAERGADPTRLTRVLQARTEEVVFEVGQWRFGTFRFEPGADHLLGDAFRFPIPDLLAAVAARQERWGGLVASFGSLEHVVAPVAVTDAASADDELVLNRTQFRVLTAAARHLSIRALADELDLGLFATGELVAGLVGRGLLSTHEPDVAPRPLLAVEPVAAAPSLPAPAPAPVPTGPFAATLAPVPVAAGVGAIGGSDLGGDRPSTDGFDELVGAHGFDGLAGFDGGAAPDGSIDGFRLPQRTGAVAPTGAEFVAPGDAPARDLILRLLTAVKEL